MRVITGTARGRRLKELEGMETRPTTSKVKESLFSVIQFDIEGRRVLDLFAGTGQLGIEALSRGAAEAVFVEKEGLKDAGKLIGITALICAISGGIALALPQSMFMVIFILMLTTSGLICSFIKPLHNLKHSYNIGMYFIYIFCIVVASMADLTSLNLTGSLNLLGYLLFAVFGSLFIQALLARIFRIDADTMVIASVTFINSPPFVPMMAAAMKNRRVLVTGLTLGIIGYAVGNYLGFLISELLKLL